MTKTTAAPVADISARFALPEALREALVALRREGRPLLVGGCVRDTLLGLPAKDFDVEVYAMAPERLEAVLASFGATDSVGRSFGVIKLRVGGAEFDFSLPRRETKTGAGHRDFAIGCDPALTPAEALARRDFTINAIAWDPFAELLIDPFAGAEDLRRRRLRHVGPAFVEDPLRVLRGFQLVGRFDLEPAPETLSLCRSMVSTYRELARERVWGEWDKWALRGRRPSLGLRFLRECGWLAHFPEISGLIDVPQEPEWHPEGDVFAHTALCCDALVGLPGWHQLDDTRRRATAFAVLAHDFGKPETTQRSLKRGRLRWTSPGHDAAGGPRAERFLVGIGAPAALLSRVRPLVENHHAHQPAGPPLTANAVRRLARRLEPASLEELLFLLWADHWGRPPFVSNEMARCIQELAVAARELQVERQAPRPLLMGRHLIALGWSPGPVFRTVLHQAYEAQLDGQFFDLAGAHRWLQENWPQPTSPPPRPP
jgi:tRNA nucleotidyltransferase (CCA-adding enzyme)